MKKYFVGIVTIVLSLFVFAGCAVGVQDMQIGKAQLNEEEQKMLSLAGFDTVKGEIYDYDVNNEIKALELSESTLTPQGVWQNTAYMQIPVEDKGSISIASSDETLVFLVSSNKGTSKYEYKYEDAKASGTSSAWIKEEEIKNITPNVPIPLMLTYKNTSNSAEAFKTDMYFSPDKLKSFDEVKAITVTFLKEIK